MNISDTIEQDITAIVEEWASFARGAREAGAVELSQRELADHAQVLLETVAAQLRVPAAEAEALDVSEVLRIARSHAAQRFEQGFSFDHLAAEFHALRASVIRRWTNQLSQTTLQEIQDLSRFGDIMDKALAASVSFYTHQMESSRALLLGILGHDLRTPLSVVHMSANYLLNADDAFNAAQTKSLVRILTSTHRMKKMVQDLLDFTQTSAGGLLPINPSNVELSKIIKDISDEVRTLHPTSQIEFVQQGNATGRWDSSRVAQAVCNMITNAVQHGSDQPIRVVATGHESEVVIEVHNKGKPIPLEEQCNLFSPLRQRRPSQELGSSGLGLGMYITREIALAHRGSVRITSDVTGTSIYLVLPRSPAPSTERRVHPDRRAH